MKPLSAADLLAVWERGLIQHPVERAVILLAAACPEMSFQDVAQLSVGQRDNRLLTLREWTFGSQLVSKAVCPVCGTELEVGFNVNDIRLSSETDAPESVSLDIGSYKVVFRLPNSQDLIALIECQDTANPAHRLLDRCLLSVNYEDTARENDQLPEKVVAAITAKMSEVDPQAETQLALSCPDCEHQWTATFNIASFFWTEINAWAYRAMQEIHLLASAYGWSERDILAMTPWKRQVYLQMIIG